MDLALCVSSTEVDGRKMTCTGSRKTQIMFMSICNVPARGFMGVEQKRNSICHVNAISKHQEASGSFMLCIITLFPIITNTENVLSVVQKLYEIWACAQGDYN